MAATGISDATAITAAELAAGDNFPVGTGDGKGKVAASALLEGLANVTADAAAVRAAMGVPSGTGTVSGANTGDQDLSGYQPLDGDLTALAALSGTNTIYYRSAANTWNPVTIGSNLSFTGGELAASLSGGGVTGPGSSTDDAIARFNGASGGTIQNSTVTLSDAGLFTLTPPTDDFTHLLFAPKNVAADGDHLANSGFRFYTTESLNDYNTTYNKVVGWGHNEGPNGQVTALLGGVGDSYESGWRPDEATHFQEWHKVFRKVDGTAIRAISIVSQQDDNDHIAAYSRCSVWDFYSPTGVVKFQEISDTGMHVWRNPTTSNTLTLDLDDVATRPTLRLEVSGDSDISIPLGPGGPRATMPGYTYDSALSPAARWSLDDTTAHMRIGSRIQFSGTGGPLIKNTAGTLEVGNAADNAYAPLNLSTLTADTLVKTPRIEFAATARIRYSGLAIETQNAAENAYYPFKAGDITSDTKVVCPKVQFNTAWLRFVAGNAEVQNSTETDWVPFKCKELITTGAITPASLADGSAANGTLYYSTTQSKLVFKDAGGVVNNLY